MRGHDTVRSQRWRPSHAVGGPAASRLRRRRDRDPQLHEQLLSIGLPEDGSADHIVKVALPFRRTEQGAAAARILVR